AAFLTMASALTRGRGMRSSPIRKFRRERSVCAPQYRSAATSMGPKESDSMRVGVAACGLRGEFLLTAILTSPFRRHFATVRGQAVCMTYRLGLCLSITSQKRWGEGVLA